MCEMHGHHIHYEDTMTNPLPSHLTYLLRGFRPLTSEPRSKLQMVLVRVLSALMDGLTVGQASMAAAPPS